MMTPWGYEVDGYLDPLISSDDFNAITGGAYAANPRVESALNAASQVVRNYCGWHICPATSCAAWPMGSGNIRRLPAGYVSEITGMTENGEAVTDYEWRKDGLIKRRCWAEGWGAAEVNYIAGYEVEAVPDLAEAVAAITAGVLSVSAGVTSESADGVSISYSQSASSIASALTAGQKSALDAYKVVNAHAS